MFSTLVSRLGMLSLCLAGIFSSTSLIGQENFYDNDWHYSDHQGYAPYDWQHSNYQNYSSPECCSNNPFQFKATLLYLKPRIDQSSFVISSTNNRFIDEVYPDGKRHLISTKYRPAYTLEGLYTLCEGSTSLGLSFTGFNSHNSSSKSGDFLFDTIGYPGNGAQAPEDTTYDGSAHINQHFKYYAADATLNRVAFGFCPDNLSFVFGLKYAYVGFNQSFRSSGSFDDDSTPRAVNNHFRQKSTFAGFGPEIGLNYSYTLPFSQCLGHFALNARANGALLISRTKAELHYTSERTGSVGVNLHNDKLYRINPAANAELGLSYALCLCGIDTTVELGYKFMWVSKCVDKITSYDVAFAGDTLDGLDDLSLYGPFLSVNIAF